MAMDQTDSTRRLPLLVLGLWLLSDALVGVRDTRGRISALSMLCKRFAAFMRRCDVESFLNIGRLYPELAPMEKRIDMHVEHSTTTWASASWMSKTSIMTLLQDEGTI
ncbi:hypothetical protein GGX14DRAFT_678419 [Mycena pura]|uniref:Dynein associated protein domain-containing protein n=1 Tax=Mycena pura TaxID=153505 RepID=A0AAD6UXX5_9AGAR|nr:hypothetical protein GGX14DRAFT_678419 [Mycena pura]